MKAVAAPIVIDIANPETWPCLMRVEEVALVLRLSRRRLYEWIACGRFPKSPNGRSWDRDVVAEYRKRIAEYERSARKTTARQSLSVVGGGR